jgi:hypothetical protein
MARDGDPRFLQTISPLLYDFQFEAVGKLHTGAILNGGTGSGKSRTALGYYFRLNGGDLRRRDSKMRKNPIDLYIITTAAKRDRQEWLGDMAPYLITTNPNISIYSHTVKIDSWNNISKYVDISGAFFIFDEDRVTGYGTWVKSFFKIARQNQWIILSATPGDTWMDYMPVFIANGFYKNKTDFCNQHIIWSRFAKFPKIDKYMNTRRLERLRDSILIDMDFNRNTVQHHEDVYCNYNHLEYRTYIKERFNIWTNEPVKNAAELCYGMRRIVNEDTDRQVKLMEIFEDHPKLIIFYNYDYEREILLNLFENVDGCKIGEWNGHAHQEVPDGPEWVYLVQYNAGAEGWNCITTDTIVFFSQTYSYKQLQQACGRIDRLNTRFVDLYYFHLKSRSGIDAAISRALSNKKKFNEGAYMRKMQIQFDQNAIKGTNAV